MTTLTTEHPMLRHQQAAHAAELAARRAAIVADLAEAKHQRDKRLAIIGPKIVAFKAEEDDLQRQLVATQIKLSVAEGDRRAVNSLVEYMFNHLNRELAATAPPSIRRFVDTIDNEIAAMLRQTISPPLRFDEALGREVFDAGHAERNERFKSRLDMLRQVRRDADALTLTPLAWGEINDELTRLAKQCGLDFDAK